MLDLFATNNKALIASSKDHYAEAFLINLQPNFNKEQNTFSQNKHINQQFTAFTDIFQNTINTHENINSLRS